MGGNERGGSVGVDDGRPPTASAAPSSATAAAPAGAATGAARRDRVADRLLALFAPDAEITVETPARTYRGRGELRHLVAELVSDGTGGDAPTGAIAPGTVATLAVTVAPAGSAATDPRVAPSSRLASLQTVPSASASGDRKEPAIPAYLKLLGVALVAGLPALATFIGIVFEFFPGFRQQGPPQVRGVEITALDVGERNRDLGDGRVGNVLYFEVETTGYDADDIAVEWLAVDAATGERLDQAPTRWGVLDVNTRTDRVVGEVPVPPPLDHEGCVFVRVLLHPASGGRSDVQPATPLLLDYADSVPFDPYDVENPACPAGTTAALGPA